MGSKCGSCPEIEAYEVLDADRDAGGPRRLLGVPMPGDEDLVAVLVHCPSTGARYHAARAAGLENVPLRRPSPGRRASTIRRTTGPSPSLERQSIVEPGLSLPDGMLGDPFQNLRVPKISAKAEVIEVYVADVAAAVLCGASTPSNRFSSRTSRFIDIPERLRHEMAAAYRAFAINRDDGASGAAGATDAGMPDVIHREKRID